jgi:DNA-directed RNA polymerase subunit RPC12/RpoP
MSADDLKARLSRAPATIECPICRHRQWLSAVEGRCDQCGSEIALLDDREAASRKLDEATAAGRVAFLRELPGGLFAVVANRAFPGKGGA